VDIYADRSIYNFDLPVADRQLNSPLIIFKRKG
jgi:hypothetical protein